MTFSTSPRSAMSKFVQNKMWTWSIPRCWCSIFHVDVAQERLFATSSNTYLEPTAIDHLCFGKHASGRFPGVLPHATRKDRIARSKELSAYRLAMGAERKVTNGSLDYIFHSCRDLKQTRQYQACRLVCVSKKRSGTLTYIDEVML
jgi:hypothetical protein